MILKYNIVLLIDYPPISWQKQYKAHSLLNSEIWSWVWMRTSSRNTKCHTKIIINAQIWWVTTHIVPWDRNHQECVEDPIYTYKYMYKIYYLCVTANYIKWCCSLSTIRYLMIIFRRTSHIPIFSEYSDKKSKGELFWKKSSKKYIVVTIIFLIPFEDNELILLVQIFFSV